MSILKYTKARRRKPHLAVLRSKGNKLPATLMSCDLEDLLIANDSQHAFRRFLGIALRLCNAGSAGMSLLRLNPAGQSIIRWQAVSGTLAAHEGAESPRNSTPCGECLDAATTTLLSEPQHFPFLAATSSSISQELIVPLYDESKNPVGTLWIAHHDPALHFGEAEIHIAEQLGVLLARALRTFEKERGTQQSATVLASHEAERRAAAHDLSIERSRREHAEASESRIREAMMFNEAEIQDAHHRVKNTMQIAANYLQLQARRTTSAQARVALLEGYSRLHLLADVHELLYKGSDPTRRVSMHDLLTTVAETLRQSFSQLSERVVLRTVVESIWLEAQIAIPLASLANEALTNAYKHAFADGRTGEVSIELHRTAEAALILRISDNGMGLKAKTVRSTLGFELIHAFAAQLGGTLVFAKPTDGSGTMLTLTVPATAVQTPPA